MSLVTHKSLFLVYLLYLMCPKRVHMQLSNQIYNVMPHQNHKWVTTQQNTKENPIFELEKSEPGFNLTDDEKKIFKIWSSGIIPYYIDDHSFDKVLRDNIRASLDNVNTISGLHFVELREPPPNEYSRWVFFINRRGQLHCGDYTTKSFTNTGVQKVVLGYDCLTSASGMPQIVLALAGIPPQHNAPNRNDHITVLTENIKPEKTSLFEILKDDEWLFHDITYDFYSAGHYNWHKYTSNGNATIKPKVTFDFTVGENAGFSYSDIWKIRMLYNYIIFKSGKSVYTPKCNELFGPGSNFSSFKPVEVDDVKPRRKPNKYLGIPDNNTSEQISSVENNSTIKTDDDEAPSKENQKKSTEKRSAEYSEREEESKNEDKTQINNVHNDKTSKTLNKHEESNSESDLGRNTKKKLKKEKENDKKKDPLTYLTDYDTEEERTIKTLYKPQTLKFTSITGRTQKSGRR